MALRQLRLMGDEILSKESKEIKGLNERTLELIDDMFDTMYESGGCGLAAVQVGVLRRLFVVDGIYKSRYFREKRGADRR